MIDLEPGSGPIDCAHHAYRLRCRILCFLRLRICNPSDGGNQGNRGSKQYCLEERAHFVDLFLAGQRPVAQMNYGLKCRKRRWVENLPPGVQQR